MGFQFPRRGVPGNPELSEEKGKEGKIHKGGRRPQPLGYGKGRGYTNFKTTEGGKKTVITRWESKRRKGDHSHQKFKHLGTVRFPWEKGESKECPNQGTKTTSAKSVAKNFKAGEKGGDARRYPKKKRGGPLPKLRP